MHGRGGVRFREPGDSGSRGGRRCSGDPTSSELRPGATGPDSGVCRACLAGRAASRGRRRERKAEGRPRPQPRDQALPGHRVRSVGLTSAHGDAHSLSSPRHTPRTEGALGRGGRAGRLVTEIVFSRVCWLVFPPNAPCPADREACVARGTRVPGKAGRSEDDSS